MELHDIFNHAKAFYKTLRRLVHRHTLRHRFQQQAAPQPIILVHNLGSQSGSHGMQTWSWKLGSGADGKCSMGETHQPERPVPLV
jgi:hypothetical protein